MTTTTLGYFDFQADALPECCLRDFTVNSTKIAGNINRHYFVVASFVSLRYVALIHDVNSLAAVASNRHHLITTHRRRLPIQIGRRLHYTVLLL